MYQPSTSIYGSPTYQQQAPRSYASIYRGCNYQQQACPSNAAYQQPARLSHARFSIEGPNSSFCAFWVPIWDPTTPVPSCQNPVALIFSGYADLNEAITNSSKTAASIAGTKYLTLGGGGAAGSKTAASSIFTAARLSTFINGVGKLSSSSYVGVAFDVENCDPGLSGNFAAAFAAARKAGLQVLVTTSHNAPYGTTPADARTLVQNWVADSNIDYLSPQLYSTGCETTIEIDVTKGQGVTWDDWKNAKAKVVYSVASTCTKGSTCFKCTSTSTSDPATDAQTWATKNALPFDGIIYWNDCTACLGGGEKVAYNNFCGKAYNNLTCTKQCPGGRDNECAAGESCFKDTTYLCPSFICGTSSPYKLDCSSRCPGGTDGECPSGKSCFADSPVSGKTTCQRFWCGQADGSGIIASPCLPCRGGVDRECEGRSIKYGGCLKQGNVNGDLPCGTTFTDPHMNRTYYDPYSI